MTTNSEAFFRMKSFIQPFEKVLAQRELESISGPNFVALDANELIFQVKGSANFRELLNNLAYWEAGAESHPNNEADWQRTKQSMLEATQLLSTKIIEPRDIFFKLDGANQLPHVARRTLRYGVHGIHEYRGKFFPQLVRSLLNYAKLSPDALIVDPMCGSGTTNVEASVMGFNSIGIDINPLSVLITRAKTGALKVSPKALLREVDLLVTRISNRKNRTSDWLDRLDNADQEYLKKWFPPGVLVSLDKIASAIAETPNPKVRLLFWAILSNILRPVSWQKDDDLRVRRDFESSDSNVEEVFEKELRKSTNSILAFNIQAGRRNLGNAKIVEGDAKNLTRLLAKQLGQIDAVLTSPPYANALPYLDTDRLSLSFLGLLSRPNHRKTEYQMIGNRELTSTMKREIWQTYENQSAHLPSEVNKLILLVQDLTSKSQVGFRRKNNPFLLAKYFMDMRETFLQLNQALKPGGIAFFVVGNNHTIAGDTRISIETDQLLARVGQHCGFYVEDVLPMEMLKSRDLFKVNASTAETIITFRKRRG